MTTKSKARKYAVLIITLVLLMVCGVFIFFYSRNSSKEETPKVYNYEREDNTRAITNSVYDYQNAKTVLTTKIDSGELYNKFNMTNKENAQKTIPQSKDVLSIDVNNLQNDDSVVVALLDSGVNITDDIMKERILYMNGLNCTSEGDRDDITDNNGHGTLITDIVYENTSSDVMILPIKVLDASGKGKLSWLCEGINKAIDADVDVINISASAEIGNSQDIKNALNRAYLNNVAVIVAAGNDGTCVNKDSLAYYDTTIAVGSVNSLFEISEFSNVGEQIDLYAQERYTGDNKNLDKDNSGIRGTSISAATVTSAVANIYATSEFDRLNVDNIKQTILNTLQRNDTFRESSSFCKKDYKLCNFKCYRDVSSKCDYNEYAVTAAAYTSNYLVRIKYYKTTAQDGTAANASTLVGWSEKTTMVLGGTVYTVGSDKIPTLTGYHFYGIRKNGVIYNTKSFAILENTTLEIIYQANTYDVEFDKNKPAGSPYDVTNSGMGEAHVCSNFLIKKFSTSSHWDECRVCGKKMNEVSHSIKANGWTMGDSCSSANVFMYSCDCGYTYSTPNNRQHVIGQLISNMFTYDAYRYCNVCGGGSDFHRCIKSDGSFITNSNLGVCAICGFTYSQRTHHSKKSWSLDRYDAGEDITCLCGCGVIAHCDSNYETVLPNHQVKRYAKITIPENYNLQDCICREGNQYSFMISNDFRWNVIGNSIEFEKTVVFNEHTEVVGCSRFYIICRNENGEGVSLYMPFPTSPDTTKPVIQKINTDKYSNIPTFTISGKEDYCSSVTVSILDKKGACLASKRVFTDQSITSNYALGGNWSCDLNPVLPSDGGMTDLTVVVTDPLGNQTRQEYTYRPKYSVVFDVKERLQKNTYDLKFYNFTGWNTKPDGSGNRYNDQSEILNMTYKDGDTIVLYAQWSPYKHTLHFDANGGSGVPADMTKTYGQALYLPTTKPTRTGYKFMGWNTASDGSGTSYAAGANYTLDYNGGTKTFYANWEASSTIVKFDANGGTDASWINCELWPGTSTNCLRGVITRPNYEFAGWTRTRNGIDYIFDKNGYWADNPDYWKADGGSYNGIPTATWQRDDLKGQTITLYAKWVPKVYHITLDKQGGSGGTHDKYYHIYNTLNTTRVADNPYAYNLDDNTGIATLNYKYTGGPQMFNIPYPTDYTLTVAGAQGGSEYGVEGGRGGISTGTKFMTPGTLSICVGGVGSYEDPVGGYNGGGAGGMYGVSGGGATHIAFGCIGTLKNYVNDKNSVVIVAGGGGGGSINLYDTDLSSGGAGGGTTGGSGKQVTNMKEFYIDKLPTGGTQTSGGIAGITHYVRSNGTENITASGNVGEFGKGGDAKKASSWGNYGAGGGGGYYGGGSTSMHGGAGGGSGYIGGVTDGSMTTGTNSGNGWAKITFNAKAAANYYRNRCVGVPKKTGYIFKGYYTAPNNAGLQVIDEDGYIIDENNSFTSNTTVYARWEPITYQVAYSVGDTPYVSGTCPDTQTVKCDEVFNLRAYNHKGLVGMPYKITFNGNKPAGASTNIPYLQPTISGNSEFSHYTGSDGKTYTNAQSVKNLSPSGLGTVTMTCQWNSKSVTPTRPILPGYTFLGWSDTATGAVNSAYNTFDIRPSTSAFNLSLYAKWQPNNYTITFDYNKPSVITTGTMSGNSTTTKTVTFDKAVGNLPAPTLGTSGSVQFVGWFDANGNQWTANTVYKTVGNTTLTARWKYLIEFDANKPSSASSSITGTTASAWALYGTTYKLTTNGFALTGYTFGGWNTLPNGTGTNYADGASISNLLTNANGRFILYGKWTANSYKLSYGLNKPSTATYTPVNGSGNPSTAKYDQEITINNPSLTGWTFTGWTISGYNTNTAVVDGSRYSATSWVSEKRTKFKNLTPVKDATVSFTANWSVNQYKIAYNLNKPSNASNNPMFGTNHPTAANFESTVTIDNPSLKGWTFKGWTVTGYNTNTAVVNGSRYSGATLTGTKVTSFKNLTPTHGGTVTFTAVWEPNTYTVKVLPSKPTNPASLSAVVNKTAPSGWTWDGTNKYFHKKFTYDTTTIGQTADLFYTLTGYSQTSKYFYSSLNANGLGTGTTYTKDSKNLTATNNGTVNVYVSWTDDAPKISNNYATTVKNATSTTKTFTVTMTDEGSGIKSYSITGCGVDKSYTYSSGAVSKTKSESITVNATGTLTITVTDFNGKSTTNTMVFYKTIFNANDDYIWGKTAGTNLVYTAKGSCTGYSLNLSGDTLNLTATRAGNVFKGWSTSASATTGLVSGVTVAANNTTTYYAIWKDETKPVAVIDSVTNNTSKKQTITFSLYDSSNGGNKTGSDIAGYWFGTNATYNGSGNSYTAVACDTTYGWKKSLTKEVSPTASTTYYLFAVDKAGNVSAAVPQVFYKITLNPNGNSATAASITVDSVTATYPSNTTYLIVAKGKTVTLPTAKRIGYHDISSKTDGNSNHYATSADGTQYYTTWTATATQTLYARWEANTYTVVIKPGRPTSPKSLYDVTVMTTPSGWTYDSTNKYFKKTFTYDSTNIGLTSDKFYKLTGYTPTGSFYTGQNSNGTGKGTTYTSASKNLTAVNNGTVTLYSGWVDDPPVIRVLTDDEMYNNTIWNNWGPIPVHKGKLFNNDVLLIDVVDLGSGLHDCRAWDYEVNSWSGNSTPAYDKQGARVNIALPGNQEINNLTDYTRMNSGIRTDGFLDWNGKFARVVTDWVQTEIDYNDPTSTKASYSPAHKKISSCWRYKDSTTINQWKETGEWTNLPTPTREGFTFNGWVESSVWTNQLKPNANYETLAPTAVNGIKGKYTPKASKKFYASWMRNKYNVTYNYTLNGGTSFSDASGNVKQFYYNADRGLPTSYDVKLNYAATKNGDTGVYSTSNSDGWKFMGWHTSNSNDQKQALTSFSMPARDVTLYALFKKHLVATFNQHEKVNADADTVLKTTKYEDDVWNRNTTTTLKENTLKQIYDWTNLGWTTQTAPKSTVTNNFTIWQDTVYYAQYRRWQTIRFTNMSTEKTFEDWQYRNSYSIHNLTGINYTVPAQQVYKNWKSIGWADKPAADASVVRLSGKQYHDTFDKQFWSRYEKDVIVDYSSSGGLTTPPTQVGKANYNSAKFVKYPIFKVAPAITKYSAKFVEWNSDRLGAGTSYIPNTSYKFMFSTTLHARWETIDVKSIKLDKDSIVMVVGETAKVTPTVEPLNASNGNVVYSVADPSIVEIGANAELIGKKSGTTKVTVRSVSNPEVYAECTVTICSASVSVPKLVVANSPFEVTVSSTSSQKTASLKCSYISNLTGKTTGKTYGMELFKKVGNGYTKQYLDKENEAENVIVSSNSKTPGKATLLFRTKESENSMVNDVYDGKATFKLELK